MHKIVFSGQLLPGHDPEKARSKLLSMLRLSAEQGVVLFSGKAHVIKRNLPPEEAALYQARLAKRGIAVDIDPPLPSNAPAEPAAPFPTLIVDDIPEAINGLPAPIPTTAAPPPPAPLPRPAKPLLAIAPESDEEIICPKCGERQPKRTLCRACATDMPRFLAAQREIHEESRAAQRGGLLGQMAAAPLGGTVGVVGALTPRWFDFDCSGRFGRLDYLWSGLSLWLLLALDLLLMLKTGSVIVALSGLLVIALLSLRIIALRCHDLGWNGWLALLAVVPYLGALFGLILLVVPGTRGGNLYGPPSPSAGTRSALIGIASLATAIFIYVALGKQLMDYIQPPPPTESSQQSDSLSSADVIIYTTSTCGACKEAKDYLRSRKVAFDERNVETSERYLSEFYARGGQGVPFLLVHGKSMLGFDAERFEQLLARRD